MKKQFTKQKTKFKKTIKFFLVLLMFGNLKTFSQAGAAIKFDGASDLVNLGSSLTTSLNGGNSITRALQNSDKFFLILFRDKNFKIIDSILSF
ncbi:MAG: hypothetical protein H0W73_14130 [Bacteroidetes bacterium]|nr:hypothetical protein [Bacteroidota bacterium]